MSTHPNEDLDTCRSISTKTDSPDNQEQALACTMHIMCHTLFRNSLIANQELRTKTFKYNLQQVKALLDSYQETTP